MKGDTEEEQKEQRELREKLHEELLNRFSVPNKVVKEKLDAVHEELKNKFKLKVTSSRVRAFSGPLKPSVVVNEWHQPKLIRSTPDKTTWVHQHKTDSNFNFNESCKTEKDGYSFEIPKYQPDGMSLVIPNRQGDGEIALYFDKDGVLSHPPGKITLQELEALDFTQTKANEEWLKGEIAKARARDIERFAALRPAQMNIHSINSQESVNLENLSSPIILLDKNSNPAIINDLSVRKYNVNQYSPEIQQMLHQGLSNNDIIKAFPEEFFQGKSQEEFIKLLTELNNNTSVSADGLNLNSSLTIENIINDLNKKLSDKGIEISDDVVKNQKALIEKQPNEIKKKHSESNNKSGAEILESCKTEIAQLKAMESSFNDIVSLFPQNFMIQNRLELVFAIRKDEKTELTPEKGQYDQIVKSLQQKVNESWHKTDKAKDKARRIQEKLENRQTRSGDSPLPYDKSRVRGQSK